MASKLVEAFLVFGSMCVYHIYTYDILCLCIWPLIHICIPYDPSYINYMSWLLIYTSIIWPLINIVYMTLHIYMYIWPPVYYILVNVIIIIGANTNTRDLFLRRIKEEPHGIYLLFCRTSTSSNSLYIGRVLHISRDSIVLYLVYKSLDIYIDLYWYYYICRQCVAHVPIMPSNRTGDPESNGIYWIFRWVSGWKSQINVSSCRSPLLSVVGEAEPSNRRNDAKDCLS